MLVTQDGGAGGEEKQRGDKTRETKTSGKKKFKRQKARTFPSQKNPEIYPRRTGGLLAGTGCPGLLPAGGWEPLAEPAGPQPAAGRGTGAGRPQQALPAPSPPASSLLPRPAPGLAHRPPAPGAPRPRAGLRTEHFSPSSSFFSRSFPALPACGCGLHFGEAAGQCRTGGLGPQVSVHRERVWPSGGRRGHPRKGCLKERALGSAGPSPVLLRYNFSQIQTLRMKWGKKEEESPLRTCK